MFSSLEQPTKMVLYSLASNPYDPPTPLQELHSAMDERVMALRSKLTPPEVKLLVSCSGEGVDVCVCVLVWLSGFFVPGG